ncbi:uncharacterized protein LOC116297225 [Actinia tenebrosa]|uniref:Uncharacterized protein LOC116297225 n=1 Tax=Actinia tenebrosa TaxID=6105 RepID=A0A6P8I9E4_ACTTE|nr:uncharacterized protein LOC116297225 [Actinia tenebrosa]
MGHSASIAKKYATPEKDDDEASEIDSLATVSSFRPTSPLAHADAREFTLRPPDGGTTRSRNKTSMSSHQGSYPQMNGTIPRRTLASQRNITASSSTLGSQPRSMREVRHFLVKNPEFLTGKQAKDIQRRTHNRDIHPHKQIKTKQDLYLGLFDPPIIYGKGAEPDKQLKMNQRMYLQLIYPTVSGMKYYYPSASPSRPITNNEMVVVRREDLSGQEDYMKKPNRVRTRPPLKPTTEQPSSVRSPSKQQILLEPFPLRSMSPSKSPRIPNGYTLPSSTPIRELQVQKRKGNAYVDVNLQKLPTSRTGKQRGESMEVERRFETPVNQGIEYYKPKKQEEQVVFNFDVEELGLKKKSEGAYPKDSRDNAVVPLYFRKTLAYNPKYSNSGNILSDPL